ncbi:MULTISPECIES: nuclear transport factor 2 family protein [unclassified Devosia]|uniref:nuclear transport factor 2 family protein n=1 Tax=unclassified Devosia TaxID=196773 RepID=UPI001ACCF189|nr:MULTISPECIES: nuclear transport factor 2 family protein [unclassified Devosia]MBN9363944.1 nuclear transport factor 2 family protein [Devosia sp.]
MAKVVSEGRNAAIVREYIEAIETFDLQAVGRLLHPEVVQIERPNKLYANGQSRGYDKMMADLPRGAKVLRKQSYPITAMHEAGDTVVVETRWEGIVNVPLGALQPGDAMVAHICMVITLRDGRIIRQVNYDCYEDFSAVA